MSAGSDIKQVPLHQHHVEHGGKMVPFAGFSMPVSYSGIKQEHFAVRNTVGLFDVSHMGEVEFRGPDALAALDRIITNDVSTLVDGQALYTAMCLEDGGIIDDLVVYRLSETHVFICVNASNREKDFAHLAKHASGDVEVLDTSDSWAQLALQGPNAQSLLQTLTESNLAQIKYYHADFGKVGGVDGVLISRTGYTGEEGFEIYIPVDHAAEIFDAILAQGSSHDLSLCGLGCRDTLRLEAKYLLYGQDIDESTNPVEAGLNWIVKLGRDTDFVGRAAIEAVKLSGPTRRLRGFTLQGRGVMRGHYAIYLSGEDEKIGELTSGSFSPTLEQSIGLGYIDIQHANVETVDIDIRGRRIPASVTKKPFYKRT